MKCAVCSGESIREKRRVQETTILECQGCGLEFWDHSGLGDPSTLYGESYFADPGHAVGYDDYPSLESSLRKTFVRRLARIARAVPGGRLLDLGTAFGFFVGEAERLGWCAVGVDVSRFALRQARRVNLKVARSSVHELPFRDAAFDVVSLWDVLEHLPDPHAAISEVARVLRPGGRVFLTTGDAKSLAARVSGSRWHLYTIPEHLYFFSRRSLETLLDSHDLRVVSVSTEASWYTVGYLVERLRKTLLGGRSSGRRWPGSSACVPLSLGDILIVEAQRDHGKSQ